MNLSVYEKKTLLAIDSGAGDPDEISKVSGLKRDTVLKALEWLRAKGLVNVQEMVETLYRLGPEGEDYLKEGLPERRLLDLVSHGKDSMRDLAVLGDKLKIALVWASKLGLGKVESGKFVLSQEGKRFLKEELPTERFLKVLSEVPTDKEIPEDLKWILRERRELVEEREVKEIRVDLTEKGKEILEKGLDVEEEVTSLTPEMLRTGKWRNVKFRRYDVSAPTPPIYPGRRHFARKAMEYIRRIWIEMGFQEMNGPIIAPSFWNFDALFVPQDHPARELQDTFYIEPSMGELPDRGLVSRVKRAHEKGVSGSTGWGYEWSEEEAKRRVLRTHTTILSAMTLAKLRASDLPAKFFSVGPVFRNEALDWKHLFEFHQSDGIVVSEDVNFRHLLGYLKAFLEKLGFKNVRFRPHYFPYTEMSVEPEVYHPVKKEWVELGGAGIFRPEVVEPLLGKAVPVLAWGLGVERLIVDYYGINDLRDIYKNDLNQLREIKEWWL